MLSYNFLSSTINFAILFIAFQAYITSANAINSWPGIVTHVTDGDTLWIRPTEQALNATPRKIRIDGIDAPDTSKLSINGHINSLLDQ
jgi:endonuclease YncB( thermonuclease family)